MCLERRFAALFGEAYELDTTELPSWWIEVRTKNTCNCINNSSQSLSGYGHNYSHSLPNIGTLGASVRLSWTPPTTISAHNQYCTAEYFGAMCLAQFALQHQPLHQCLTIIHDKVTLFHWVLFLYIFSWDFPMHSLGFSSSLASLLCIHHFSDLL